MMTGIKIRVNAARSTFTGLLLDEAQNERLSSLHPEGSWEAGDEDIRVTTRDSCAVVHGDPIGTAETRMDWLPVELQVGCRVKSELDSQFQNPLNVTLPTALPLSASA
jgi:hypothetical protein